jgi:hypothetical protein
MDEQLCLVTKAQPVFAPFGMQNILPTMVTVISHRKEIAFIEDI